MRRFDDVPELYLGFSQDREYVAAALAAIGFEPDEFWEFAYDEIARTDEFFGRPPDLIERETIRVILSFLQ